MMYFAHKKRRGAKKQSNSENLDFIKKDHGQAETNILANAKPNSLNKPFTPNPLSGADLGMEGLYLISSALYVIICDSFSAGPKSY